ncbi:MAG: DUF971 domain-containing protein [Balneolaceae bacterium]|nr:MAG: DUF971 domain-containing protein [Balneolaceae bacterium]
MEARFQIKKITVDSELRELQILWADGHLSRFPMEGLRKACPCVFCQGGHENMGKPVDPSIFLERTEHDRLITRISQVGNYAIQIHWNDGHQTGIYRFERLRGMCPVEKGII